MKRVAPLIALLGVLFLLVGCGPKTYTTPGFEQFRQNHRTVAILPFQVNIDPKKLPKDFTPEMAKESEREEAYNIQQQLYMRFLERQKKDEYTITFQDVDKTVALLGKKGITNANIAVYTKTELRDILGVDALISGSINRTRPMSTGTAIALGLLVGFWGNTNKVDVNLSIHDGASGDLMWKYEHKASGSVGSSSEELAKSLMKSISKKFPYKRPKT